MNKQEAQLELAKLAERQAELQKIVDAAPKSLLCEDGIGAHCISNRMENSYVGDVATAIRYADALDTLLLLRHQPGTEAASDGKDQWLIDTSDDGLTLDYWMGAHFKLRFISPCFASDADAQAAIDTIGADRILRMFHTLHGVA